jgi:Sec-independent protein translocase protein TatA
MFDLSPEKLIVVAAIAMTVLGPQRIPQVVRSLLRVSGEIGRLTAGARADLDAVLQAPRDALADARAAVAGPLPPPGAGSAGPAPAGPAPDEPTPDDPTLN